MSKGEDGATNGYDDQNLPDDWQSQLRQLVLAYLVHNCYQETAMCFSASVNNFPKTGDGSSGVTTTTKSTSVTTDQLADKASASTSQASLNEGNDVSTAEAAKTTVAKMEIETRDDGMLESLSHRKRLKNLIMDGQVLHAIEFCQQYYPRQIIATGALCGAKEHQDWTYSSQQIELSFQLHCQHFIELVRQDKQADALSYAQNILSPFGLHFPHLLPTLRDIVALIAYQRPAESPVAKYLSVEHRQQVAELLNSSILASYGLPTTTVLETLIRQLITVRDSYIAEVKSDKKSNSAAAQALKNWKISDLLSEALRV